MDIPAGNAAVASSDDRSVVPDLYATQQAALRSLPWDGPGHVSQSNHRTTCQTLARLGLIQILSTGASSTVAALTDPGKTAKQALMPKERRDHRA